MTQIKYKEKPIWRETATLVRERGIRPLLVALTPDGLLIRAKGLRNPYLLPWRSAHERAAWLVSMQRRLEKARKIKECKSLRRGGKNKN